jgi:hypothetical protein
MTAHAGISTIVRIAQRLAYDLAIWHEILTYVTQPNSSFSPQDGYSNLLGTYLAAETIIGPRPVTGYNAGIDVRLDAWLTRLGAQPISVTKAAFEAVRGPDKWWERPTLLEMTHGAILHRRHFDIVGKVSPWLPPGSPESVRE